MLTRTVCACGLVLSLAGIVNAESVITYESFDDQTPGDAGIVLGAPGGGADFATVEIWLTPTDGIATSFGAGGYEFSGTDHGDGSVTSPDGGITSSNHVWADPFQNVNEWFSWDALPNPQTVGFFPPGEPVPLEGLLLGTLTVTANNVGTWEQPTNPIEFFTGFLEIIPLASGSEFFTVTVLPEPTTAMLFGLGAVILLRRRQTMPRVNASFRRRLPTSTRTVCACGLVLSLAGIVNAESVITYESFDDQTPGDPGIVLGEPGEGSDSATVEIWLTPTDGIATTFGAGGFEYDGTDHGDGSVTSPDGGITSSDHMWAEQFQNPGVWFTVNPLPEPITVGFFPPGEPVPLEGLLLGTLTITANNVGMWEQYTNPYSFVNGNLDPLLLAPGSEFFTVTVLPEPTAATLFGLGAMILLRRKR